MNPEWPCSCYYSYTRSKTCREHLALCRRGSLGDQAIWGQFWVPGGKRSPRSECPYHMHPPAKRYRIQKVGEDCLRLLLMPLPGMTSPSLPAVMYLIILCNSLSPQPSPSPSSLSFAVDSIPLEGLHLVQVPRQAYSFTGHAERGTGKHNLK